MGVLSVHVHVATASCRDYREEKEDDETASCTSNTSNEHFSSPSWNPNLVDPLCNVGESPGPDYTKVPNGHYKIAWNWPKPALMYSNRDKSGGVRALRDGTIVNIMDKYWYTNGVVYKITTTVGQTGWLFSHHMGKVGSDHGRYDIIRVNEPDARSSPASVLVARAVASSLMDSSRRRRNQQSSRQNQQSSRQNQQSSRQNQQRTGYPGYNNMIASMIASFQLLAVIIMVWLAFLVWTQL